MVMVVVVVLIRRARQCLECRVGWVLMSVDLNATRAVLRRGVRARKLECLGGYG